MDLSIVLPAYLEEENLVNILPALNQAFLKYSDNYEIIVVDTKEPMDNSKEVCNKNNTCYINRENGNMYGDAIRTGIKYAKGNKIMVMDADGSHRPADAVRLYEASLSNEADLIIGSRYCKGGYTENPFILKAMSWCLNLSYRVIFGLKVKDVSNSFRIYDAEKLKELKLECDNFDIVEEIIIKLKDNNEDFKAREIPISFDKRDKGESKRNLLKFIFSYIKTIVRLLNLRNRN